MIVKNEINIFAYTKPLSPPNTRSAEKRLRKSNNNYNSIPMKSWEWKKPINKLFNDSQIHKEIKPQKMIVKNEINIFTYY